MAKKEKKGSAKRPSSKVKPASKDNDQEFSDPAKPLMPELEELVKKNPNRLIGCGG